MDLQEQTLIANDGVAPKIFATSLAGRYGRLTFINVNIIYAVIIFGVGATMLMALQIAGIVSIEEFQDSVFYFIVQLVCLIPYTRIIILRLHDVNKSGKNAIPIIGLQVVADAFSVIGWRIPSSVLAFMLFIVVMILLIAPGTKGANLYGAQPKKGSMVGLIVLIFSGLIVSAHIINVFLILSHQ